MNMLHVGERKALQSNFRAQPTVWRLLARAEKIAAAMASRLDHLDAVIFLDVDGVLHPLNACADLVPRCLDALKQALRSSNAKLVLSSAWRTDPQGRSEVAARLNIYWQWTRCGRDGGAAAKRSGTGGVYEQALTGCVSRAVREARWRVE